METPDPTPKEAAEAIALAALRQAHLHTPAFCEVYSPKTLHPARGLVEFLPYRKQAALMNDLDAGRSVLVHKSRQTGASETVMLQRLRWCLVPGTTHLIVSKKESDAKNLIARAKRAALSCDPPFPLRIATDNALCLEFENDSRIVGESSSPETGRSWPATSVLLDEVRALQWPEEMWQSLAPTVTQGGSLCMVSTPDIQGSFFYRHWSEVSSGQSAWAYHVLHWSDLPNRDAGWAERTKRELKLTDAQWGQEYELEWGSLSDAVFNAASIDRAIDLGREPWERPATIGPNEFAMGGDLSGGGRASTVLLVLDKRAMPHRVVDVADSEAWTAPKQQAEIERVARAWNAVPWLDRTGVGWSIVGNLSLPVVGVAFTGGREVTGTNREPNIPRERLWSHLAFGLEQGQVAIPPERQEVILGLRSATWSKTGLNHDFVDALALAFWAATGGDRKGTGVFVSRPSDGPYRKAPATGLAGVSG